jgi:hypothetical protein
LGRVNDWSHDQSASYLNKFQEALARIENSLPKVSVPLISGEPFPMKNLDGSWTVKFNGSALLTFSAPEPGVKVRITRNEDPLNAKTYITVDSVPQEITVKESCTYYAVSLNGQNESSKVERISLTNLDDSSKLVIDAAPKLDPAENSYRFMNPVNRAALVVLLRDLLAHIKSDKLISDAEILAAVKEALQAEFNK